MRLDNFETSVKEIIMQNQETNLFNRQILTAMEARYNEDKQYEELEDKKAEEEEQEGEGSGDDDE